MAKNVARRALLNLVDPGPNREQVSLIWDFFESRCAYCDRELIRGTKQGHVDHLVSASAAGRNHIANRVLACASCNEVEKRDMDWEAFLEMKCPDVAVRTARKGRIERWKTLNHEQSSGAKLEHLAAADLAATEIAAMIDEKVKQLRALVGRRPPGIRRKTESGVVRAPVRRREGITVAYRAPRLTFRAAEIEALEMAQSFQVDTPQGSFVMTREEFHKEFPGVVASESYRKGLYHYAVTPRRAYDYLIPALPDVTLDEIVDRLDGSKRRATYGAIGGVLGRLPRSVMSGRPKTHRNSWIVSAADGLPTGYSASELHPELLICPLVIDDASELVRLLTEHRTRLTSEAADAL